MSTRSRIAVMHGEVCKSIYCHFDGYFEGVGETLAKHYDSSNANHLVALGDMSSLGTSIGEAHPFSPFTDSKDPEEQARVEAEYKAAKDAGWSTFYGRDRGEEDTSWQVAHSFEEFLEQVDACGGEYYYVMENGQWYCGSMSGKFERRLVLLSEVLETVEA